MNTNEKRRRMAQLQSELEQLSEMVAREERDCVHDFTDPVSDPEEYQEAVFDHYEGHGSDPNPVYRYYTATRPRWSRVCKKCGKKEYTYHMKPVAHAPDFANHSGPDRR